MDPVKPPCTQRHLLVCTHQRDANGPKPSCGAHGGQALRDALKLRVKAAGLKGQVKVTATGCLDYCPAEGIAVGFYPDDEHYIVDSGEQDALWERLVAPRA
jgi:predicted metal-binding protein